MWLVKVLAYWREHGIPVHHIEGYVLNVLIDQGHLASRSVIWLDGSQKMSVSEGSKVASFPSTCIWQIVVTSLFCESKKWERFVCGRPAPLVCKFSTNFSTSDHVASVILLVGCCALVNSFLMSWLDIFNVFSFSALVVIAILIEAVWWCPSAWTSGGINFVQFVYMKLWVSCAALQWKDLFVGEVVGR